MSTTLVGLEVVNRWGAGVFRVHLIETCPVGVVERGGIDRVVAGRDPVGHHLGHPAFAGHRRDVVVARAVGTLVAVEVLHESLIRRRRGRRVGRHKQRIGDPGGNVVVMSVVEERQPSIRDRQSAAGQIAGQPVAVCRLQLRAVRALRFAEDLQLHWGSRTDPTITPLPSAVRGTSACAVPVANITNHSAVAANTRRQDRIVQPPLRQSSRGVCPSVTISTGDADTVMVCA